MSELIRVFLIELLVASRDAALLALLIGIVILLFGRSIPPTWRHVLWLLVALRLCLPVLPSSPVSWQRLLPEKADPVAAKSFDEQPAPASPQPSKTTVVPIPVEPESFRVPASEPEASPMIAKQNLRINGWILGGALWLSGCLICFSVGICSLFRFRKRLRRLAVTDEPMIAEVKRVVREISPSRPYRINLTEAVHVPAVHGLFRPEILLPPSSIETLDEEALRLILWHEIAHLRRGDLWVNWLLFYLQALHWFNPAMWWAFRKTRIAAESAADAWVLRQSRCEAKPVDYGEALLGFLERENSATARHFLPGLVRVVERPQDLKARIKAIARFSQKRSRWATAATCALLFGLSAVGLTQAPEEKESEEATPGDLEIRATVRDENGDPVQDATVTLVAYTPFSKRTLEAVSDRDGEAIFDPAELDELPGRMNGEFYAKKETVGLSARGYTFSWDEGKRKSVAVELVLSEGLPLRLRVVDLEGFPVEGLEVFASRFSEKDRESGFLSANPSKLESNPWSATTNSNGEATLRRIPRNAKVYVDHRDNRYGQVEGAHHTQFRFDPEAEEENRIDLEPASTISGRVVLPGDLPVAGAEVRALEHYGYVRGGSHGNAVTAANGTFTLPRMLASVYSIKVTLPDDLAEDWVVPILHSVEVEIGEDILLDDLMGESGGLIEGRVTLPDSEDGVPYAQVGITVPEKVSPLYQWWGKADESGRYRIRLESGLKKLYLGGLPPEGYRRPAQENRTILVLEGQTQEADFSFENASEFSGRVVDEEGNPVEGAIVQSWPQSFPMVRASTDERGNFAFTPFDTTNELSVIAHKGNSFSGEAAITPESFIDLVLLDDGFASVSGKIVDEDGKPVRGAMVRWFGQRLSESFDVETGPDGTFSIDRLVPSESFGVSAEKSGHGKVSLYAATSRGKNTSLPDLILPKAESMVSGQVTDESGNPLPLTLIRVEGEGQREQSIRTDKEGNFRIDGLVGGWLWLFVVGDESSKKFRVRSGSEETALVLPQDSNAYDRKEVIDLVGKRAPALRVAKWFGEAPPDPKHEGKIRMIRFLGHDRSLKFFSSTISLMEDLREEFKEKDVEFLLVHGPWPEEEVAEIVQQNHPELGVPLALEDSEDPMSGAFGIETRLAIVTDRKGNVVYQHRTGKGSKKKIEELLEAETPDQAATQSQPESEAPDSFALPTLVTNSEGEPLSGADIYLLLHGATGSRLSDRAITDHEGRAEVQIDLAEVQRDLAFRFEIVGYSESKGVGSTGVKMLATLDQSEFDQSYNIALSRGKDQPIRVTDSSGNPVKGLRVEFDPLISSNFIQSIPKGLPDGVWNSKTDASGQAVIRNVPENASMLFSHEDERFGSWKDSYVPWSKQNHEVGEEIELQALEANELSGRVTLSNGKAVPRVLVGAILVKGRSGNPTWPVFSSWTDENGDFRIGKLPRGEFSVRAQIWDPELIENWTDPFLTGLHLAEGSKKEGLELVATKGGTLKVAVTGSRTGHPVRGVTFELNDLNGISVLHQPKIGWRLFNEAFDTKLLPEGEFSLKISHPLPSGYVFSGKNEEKTVAIKTGETTEVAFELLELAPVEVRVVNKAGEPVEGAQVVYFDPSKETGHQIAKSGSDGMCYFSVEKIEDTYLIAFDGQAGSYEPVSAKSGEEVELRLLEESLAGVRGTLVDEEGNPVLGAKIIYGSMGVPGDRKETFTDAKGGFQVSGIVPRDEVELFLEKDGFALGFVKVDLEANQVEKLGEISLKKGSHSITGQVYDQSGAPVDQPYIRIGRSGKERVLSEGFADNNGVFTFTTLPNEKLWVEAGISTVEGHSIKISEAIPSKEKLRIVLDPVEQTKSN